MVKKYIILVDVKATYHSVRFKLRVIPKIVILNVLLE